MRLAIVQYGDYAEAERRFAAGGSETYYAQRQTVEFIAGLTERCQQVTVLTLFGDRPQERLESGVHSLGVELYPKGRRPRHLRLLRELERLRPDHLVLATPEPLVLAWALARRVRTLPLFADSFRSANVKARVKHAVLAGLLSLPQFEWVSNHNLAASLELVRIGVDPAKVVPFDWPVIATPSDSPPKRAPAGDAFRMIFVGQISEAKGVGDLLAALRLLRGRPGPQWSATLVGREDPALEQRAREWGMGESVRFCGIVPHERVIALMREHDAVVVPSRHDCAEGLPMTIYEGLCSRTPLVVSDHPMFRLKVRDGIGAMVFRAGDPSSLAACLERLQGDPDLYGRLSTSGEQAASGYFTPLKYDSLISAWLESSRTARVKLAPYSIASGRYESRSLDPPPVPR
jgi:glycosyltransferase involved in cell wall biosynthesis